MGTGFVIAALVLGVGLGWLLARRSTEQAARTLELELATARAQLAARQTVEGRVGALEADNQSLRGALARAETESRLVGAQVAQQREAHDVQASRNTELHAQLSAAAAAVARAQSELTAASERAARAEDFEARFAEAQELVARREAELHACQERRAGLESELGALAPVSERAQALAESLARTQSQLDGERTRAAERVAELEATRVTMRLEFEALGQKLLEEKGKSMLDQSHKGLEGLLTPVRERLKEFEEKFQKTFDQDNRDRASLLEKLRQLQETQSKLHDDAAALSRALTGDNRAQGDWGELVLESLLETAGLTQGREYELQVDHRNDEGNRRRPDALVYLPGNRAIVIDAKCSLTAYVASTKAVSPEQREVELEAHVQSVRSHVRQLAAKDYQAAINERTLDFVFLFVPSEAAFYAALSRAPELSEEAMRQRVVVCSPTTVLATLQMVHHVWRSERQAGNAQRIAEEAGKMIDKLSAALEAFNEVGSRLDQAQAAFDVSRKRLSTGAGNVVAIANKVVQLGARVGKAERLEAVQKALDAEAEPTSQGQLELDAGASPLA